METEFTISAAEAGKKLNVSPKTINRYCERLGIAMIKSGKRFVCRLNRKNFERVKKCLTIKSK